jgi:hypothetical protein
MKRYQPTKPVGFIICMPLERDESGNLELGIVDFNTTFVSI